MKLKSNSSIIQYKPIEVKKTAEKVVDALVHLRNLSFSGECEQRDGVEFREDSRAESFLFFLAYREREGEFEREKSQGSDSIKRRESDRGNGGREGGCGLLLCKMAIWKHTHQQNKLCTVDPRPPSPLRTRLRHALTQRTTRSCQSPVRKFDG